MALWGGRFSQSPDDLLRFLNDSLRFDRRMAAEDIRGSMAYARALASAGVVSSAEAEALREGLQQVLAEFEADKFNAKPDDEDIHTAVERRLTELVGAVGGKLHTGRSRNDQVATDVRLYTLRSLDQLDMLLANVQAALLTQAEAHLETLMPGYTHLQPAQPITAAHWLMSYVWMLDRDRDRLADARRRVSVMPLGSGALAGTPFDIDRATLAEDLGFKDVSQNSLDAVSDRDFIAESLFVMALIGVHLSRFGEDVLLYSNPALGFVSLDERYSTGSSLMPQKRNADPMELARGKAGRLNGHLAGVLTMLKGLPSGYNKDLQEDKEALFDGFDTLEALLPVVAAVISTMTLHSDAMTAALDDDLLATDMADYLVDKGVPFREAHHIVGRAVQAASESSTPLSKLPLETLLSIDEHFTEDVYEWLTFERSVARRRADGGTAPDAVRRQIAAARQRLTLKSDE
jgi:argininosuccinate lyase